MLKRIAPALVLAALFAPSLASAQTVPWTPPPCFGIFNDVPCTPYVGFSDWIEALSVEGVTAGCGGGNYCPDLPVTRAQMTVFLLKLEHRTVFGKALTCGNPGDYCTSYVVIDPQIKSTMNIVATYANLGGLVTNTPYPLMILDISDGSFTITGMGGAPFFYVAREW